ncbi:LLM class flavin-dependent oxidoreductase [Segnochrobactrum spirostomi]|uniref:LLM class flavin-dependent oxidoreductase n=1 Tax=Segnochrobactrum spirostomi TaxID=2608987 RepID=A0A6A7YAE5_9HYPH|nr:LLM class flavin-dependent oxidoreductase [Segnochrobactrum spirostomi]MQT14632.1 LLM class flavin-dependent oxidoreductase [Segnochrobactrum spirostomi]
MTTSRRMKLGASFYPSGYHVAGWRYPGAVPDGGINLAHHIEVAQGAEKAGFDFFFLADINGIWDPDIDAVSYTTWSAKFEPLTVLSALAMVTSRIGLVATASTTYNDPFNLARRFASLDHISGGRAAWNLVTSATASEAANFSRDSHPDHGDRYARAREFVEVVTGLWDGWEDDAYGFDRANGRCFDPAKVHRLDHRGPFFQVAGPLNLPRPVQGHPVMVQAGLSEAGRDLAAATGEVLFTAQPTLDGAKAFYRDVKARVVRYGRDPAHLSIMPGAVTVIGQTKSEAEDQIAALNGLLEPKPGLAFMSGLIGDTDLSRFPLDEPLPPLPKTEGPKGRQQLVVERARRDGATLRELYQSIALTSSHRLVYGSPVEVADQLEDWFVAGGCDGYNIAPAHAPQGFTDFFSAVVPELQRRGLVRTRYEGSTLRENLGLPRPATRYAAATEAEQTAPDPETIAS